MRTRIAWLGVAAVVLAAIFVGTTDRGERTEAERVDDVAASVMCPACRGQSVRDSDAIVARNIKSDIERRVAAGQSDEEIRDALADAFGEQILLNPPSSGLASLVWILPVAALIIAGAAVAVAFRRWRELPLRS